MSDTTDSAVSESELTRDRAKELLDRLLLVVRFAFEDEVGLLRDLNEPRVSVPFRAVLEEAVGLLRDRSSVVSAELKDGWLSAARCIESDIDYLVWRVRLLRAESAVASMLDGDRASSGSEGSS